MFHRHLYLKRFKDQVRQVDTCLYFDSVGAEHCYCHQTVLCQMEETETSKCSSDKFLPRCHLIYHFW